MALVHDPSIPSMMIKRWEELVDVEASFEGHDEWAFRGQNTCKFPATTLERHCSNLRLTGNAIEDLEVKLIRDFARRYHLYAGYPPPSKGYTLEWLSLLRHYGTPTRLVDFSYSFFFALFFGIEKAKDCGVVWAFNVTKLKNAADEYIVHKLPDGQKMLDEYSKERDEEPFRNLFMEPKIPFVYPANPIKLNERLTIQQGLFRAPGDVTSTFEENMRVIPNYIDLIKKFIIDPGCWHDFLRRLYRMGINRATLFPGLEGFAQSLYTKSLILKDLPKQGLEKLKQV